MKKLFMIMLCMVQLNSFAQSNLGCMYDSLVNQMICGSMTIQGDAVNMCNDGCKLWVDFTSGSGFSSSLMQEALGSTDSYKVASQPFIFEPQTNPVSANIYIDDIWSQVIPLPFKFCFFENKYNSIVIGANGQISFDASLAGQFNWYNTAGWPALPYFNNSVNNAIFCPYHDLDITAAPGGNINYSVEGVAPCRKFIITWDNVALFHCNNLTATQQIVLTEGSYRIDVNVINKPVCPAWLNGTAYLGVQNDVATKAFTPPGYNGGAWTTANESWSFIPIGTANITTNSTTNSVTQGLYWVDSFSNNIIGFGDTLYYWPSADTTIYVFFGDTTLLNDSCFLGNIDTCINECGKGFAGIGCPLPYIRLTVLNPDASFTFTETPNCIGAVVQFINTSNSGGSATYLWDFGDGTFDTQPNPLHNYIGTGPFYPTLIASEYGCSDSMMQIITPVLTTVQASFTVSANNVCGSSPIITMNTSTGVNLAYIWNMGDGTIYNTIDVTHSYASTGSYTIMLIAQDSVAGCADTAYQLIDVDDSTVAKFSATPSLLCVGQTVYFKDEINSRVLDFYYTFGTGDSSLNIHNPTYTYENAGDYAIQLHSKYAICPNQTATSIVHVDEYPLVELGEPEEICPGNGAILIQDLNNPTAVHLWKSGETSNSILVKKPGEYEVAVSIGNCTVSDKKIINLDLDCIFIPSAFSPNGDGLNDYFTPVWADESYISTYRMFIYNRFGQKVFSTDDKLSKGWNGKFKNQYVPVNTYMYFIEILAQDGNKKVFKGDVTIIR
jgi:gliding motility-associated-like protein